MRLLLTLLRCWLAERSYLFFFDGEWADLSVRMESIDPFLGLDSPKSDDSSEES